MRDVGVSLPGLGAGGKAETRMNAGKQREPQLPRRSSMSTKSLYVGNLSYDTTENGLRDHFESWGPVSEVRLIESRGFGFVQIPAENAEEAIAGANGTTLDGRELKVNEARPRAERGGGGGGGRDRRDGGGGGGNRW